MKGKKILLSLAILSSLSLTLGSGSCNAPIFNLNFEFLDFFQSCAGMLPDEENNEDIENENNENFAEVSQYFKYTLNEDGKSYSVGFWSSFEELEEIVQNQNFNGVESSRQYFRQYFPQANLQGVLNIPSFYNNLPITAINEAAFPYCSFDGIVIPDSVTSIGDSAFGGWDNLTSVVIPDSVNSIGENAFYRCDSLTSVYISDIESWCNIEFKHRESNPLNNGANLYLNNELVIELIIPDTVTEIKNYAFYDCESLTSVEIPDSVTSIGFYAFWECSSLTSVKLSNSPIQIKEGAFANCSSLTKLVIPPSVTFIGKHIFWNCSNLTIYCELESQPEGWDPNWNGSNCPVVWEYKE